MSDEKQIEVVVPQTRKQNINNKFKMFLYGGTENSKTRFACVFPTRAKRKIKDGTNANSQKANVKETSEGK